MSRIKPTLALAALAAAALCCPPLAAAGDGQTLNMTGFQRLFTGIPHHVALVDPIAYVALDTGLQIVNVGTATTPTVLSHVYLPGVAWDVEVVGRYAYVADGEGGIQVVDVIDPSNPVLVASRATSDARGITVAGGHAYVAEAGTGATGSGLRVVQMPTATTFGAEAFVALGNGALDVAVSGATAYVALGATTGSPQHGLQPVNVTVPLSPVAGALLRTGKPIHEVVVAGGFAYCASGFNSSGSFVTVNTTTMTVVSNLFIADAGMGVAVRPGVAYVAARSQGLVIYDVNGSGVATRRTSLPTGIEAVAVAARQDAVFLGERSSIQTARLTAVDVVVSPPRIVGQAAYAEATGTAFATGRALLLRRDALFIFDASNLMSLQLLSTWGPSGSDFSSVDAEGSVAAVGEGTSVHLLDLTNPTTPVFDGDAVITIGNVVKPVLHGTVLYVVNGVGLEVFDATNLASGPTASLVTAGNSADLAIEGTWGYLVAGDSLLVFDLSAPLTPTLQRSVPIPGEQLYAVAVDTITQKVVASGLNKALYVFDVTTRSNPVLVGSITGPRGWAARLQGSKALVASGVDGLRVYDVPTLAEVAYYDTSGSANALSMSGQGVFLSTLEAQHWVVNCDVCLSLTPCASAPIVAPNTFLAVKRGASAELHWTLDPTSPPPGQFNGHRTLLKRDLIQFWLNQGAVVWTGPPLIRTNPFVLTSRVAFWQVFGACSNGTSRPD